MVATFKRIVSTGVFEDVVVAVVTEVDDGDYRPLEAVRAELTLEATINAKAAYLIKQLSGVQSLEAAAEITGTPVQTVEKVSLADYRFGNAGAEPTIIGATLAMAENTLSEPLQGKMGIFVVKTGAKTTATAELDAAQEKASLTSRATYSLPYQAISLLEEKAEVVDNRANFQ